MKTYVILISILICWGMDLCSQSQTYYYGNDYGIMQSGDKARYKKEVEEKSAKKTLVVSYEKQEEYWKKIKTETFIQKNDTLTIIRRKEDKLWSQKISRSFHPAKNGLWLFTDRINGSLISCGTASSMIPLHFQDTVKSYYSHSILKSVAVYYNNRLLSNKNWLRNGSPYFDNIHYFVDKIPEHSMGQAFFRSYIIAGLKESGINFNEISDRVVIGWTVLEDGEAAGFHAVSGMFSELNSVLINLLKDMPGEWIPASIHGKAVKYYMEIPFNFIDRTENFESLELSSGFVVWD